MATSQKDRVQMAFHRYPKLLVTLIDCLLDNEENMKFDKLAEQMRISKKRLNEYLDEIKVYNKYVFKDLDIVEYYDVPINQKHKDLYIKLKNKEMWYSFFLKFKENIVKE